LKFPVLVSVNFIKVKKTITYLARALIEGFVPRTCLSCSKPIPYYGHVAGACSICVVNWGVYAPGVVSNTLFKERMNCVWSAMGFRLSDGGSRAMIHKCKYGGEPWRVKQLGEWIATRWDPPPEGVVLVPVPIHPKRKLQRGYNQAERLAAGLGEVWGVKVDEAGLIRKKKNRSKMSPVILVDDVLTTGATLRECREILELRGRVVIGAVVLALA
jgi:predicted amidophosphoribosyltransferase